MFKNISQNIKHVLLEEILYEILNSSHDCIKIKDTKYNCI